MIVFFPLRLSICEISLHVYLIFSPKAHTGMPYVQLMMFCYALVHGTFGTEIFHLVCTSRCVVCCWTFIISSLRNQILVHYKPQAVAFFKFPLLLQFINGSRCSPSNSIIGILSQSLQSKWTLEHPYLSKKIEIQHMRQVWLWKVSIISKKLNRNTAHATCLTMKWASDRNLFCLYWLEQRWLKCEIH